MLQPGADLRSLISSVCRAKSLFWRRHISGQRGLQHTISYSCRAPVANKKVKKNPRDDVFNEIMNASAAADTELRAWRISLSDKLNLDMDTKKAAQVYERSTEDEMLCIMLEQSDMLRRLAELQEAQWQEKLPLQPLQKSELMHSFLASTPKRSSRKLSSVQYVLHSSPVEGSRKR